MDQPEARPRWSGSIEEIVGTDDRVAIVMESLPGEACQVQGLIILQTVMH